MKHLAALLLLSVLPLAAQADSASAMPRVLTTEAAIAGINSVALDVGVGEMHVTASSDDKLHVQVTLRRKEREVMWFFHWVAGGTRDEIAAATIRQKTSGDRLMLSLDYPHSAGNDDMKQEWDVQVPPRLKVEATMEVGDLRIEGVEGGVGAKLNVGEVSIDVPKGAIDANVDVGEIRAKTATDRHGKIDLTTNIGDTVLIIQGSDSGYHDHSGLGSRISLEGSGPDAMRLKVNIGDVSLHVTPADTVAKGAGK